MNKKRFRIGNEQGAFLMYVVAKDAKNALRQARKMLSGKLLVTEAD